MVRNYVRKSNNIMYDEDTIINALRTLKKTNKSLREVATEYNMKMNTLWYHWRKHNNKENVNLDDENFYKKRYVFQVFSEEQEYELLSYVTTCPDVYWTVSQSWIRQFAYELACEKKVIIPPNWKTEKKAGKDWLLKFRQRHKPVLNRYDERYATIEQMIKVHKKTGSFFKENYTKVLSKYKFQPKDVFVLEQCKLRNVYVPDGGDSDDEEKPIEILDALRSATLNGNSLVTFVGALSAVGQSIPPYYIFSFSRYRNHQLLRDAPQGSKANSDPTGTMTKKIFVDYLKHLADNVDCSRDKPVLLLLDDNDGYHVSLGALKFARDNGIVILTFPPRTKDKLKYLEQSVFDRARDDMEDIRNEEKMIMELDEDEARELEALIFEHAEARELEQLILEQAEAMMLKSDV